MALLDEVTRGAYQLEPFSADDVSEAGRIMERFADLRIGLADASVVVLASDIARRTCCVPTSGTSVRFGVSAGDRSGCCRTTPENIPTTIHRERFRIAYTLTVWAVSTISTRGFVNRHLNRA
jgi:hypothetical protein